MGQLTFQVIYYCCLFFSNTYTVHVLYTVHNTHARSFFLFLLLRTLWYDLRNITMKNQKIYFYSIELRECRAGQTSQMYSEDLNSTENL